MAGIIRSFGHLRSHSTFTGFACTFCFVFQVLPVSHGCKVINTSLQVHNHYKIEVLRSFFLLRISLSISYALNMYAIKDY